MLAVDSCGVSGVVLPSADFVSVGCVLCGFVVYYVGMDFCMLRSGLLGLVCFLGGSVGC